MRARQSVPSRFNIPEPPPGHFRPLQDHSGPIARAPGRRMTIPEPVRAWARPVLACLTTATALAAVMLAGVTAVLNLGTVAGIGITVTLFAVTAGTGVWWIDRKGLL